MWVCLNFVLSHVWVGRQRWCQMLCNSRKPQRTLSIIPDVGTKLRKNHQKRCIWMATDFLTCRMIFSFLRQPEILSFWAAGAQKQHGRHFKVWSQRYKEILPCSIGVSFCRSLDFDPTSQLVTHWATSISKGWFVETGFGKRGQRGPFSLSCTRSQW